ncbi:response regulator [Pseudomonas putida]|uniref:response regulator n=1 Tax=Pseudomonas putida TaxID=303 RepID=UPI0023662DAB|nr:response regulator [Pseudomonas putida]MDD2047753.1 LuxR C-terminal-related transcriptional regulator [Pseudomonas putida]
MATVLIADAMPIVRSALRNLLADMGHPDVEEAADVPTALTLTRQSNPQLVILELALPGPGGLDLLRRLRARDGSQKVLVYSHQNPAHFAPLCFQAGASGFVGKLEDMTSLRKAIADVLAGRGHFAREYMQPGGGSELDNLTPREAAVLQLIAEGRSNLRIADELSISFKTVSTYKAHLLEKLHVSSNVELADIARRNGLVAGQEPAAGALTADAIPAELGLLRNLVDAAPNPMFVRTTEGRLLFCNQKFLDYYRITAEEALGSGFAEARWFSPAVRKMLPEGFARIALEGVPMAVTTRVEIFGEARVMHFWMVPYRDSQGHACGVLGGLQDITDSEGQLVNLRDRWLAAQAQAQQQADFYEASLNELAGCVTALALHPATPGLSSLSNRLKRLQRLYLLQEGSGAPPVQVCDLPAFIGRCLIGHPQSLFGIHRIDTRWVWLGTEAFSDWMTTAIGLFQVDSDNPVWINLQMCVRGQGQVQARLELSGQAGPQSIIDLNHCQRVAQYLQGKFVHGSHEQRLAIELELNLPQAGSPSAIEE